VIGIGVRSYCAKKRVRALGLALAITTSALLLFGPLLILRLAGWAIAL
jgi:hypothetical protein